MRMRPMSARLRWSLVFALSALAYLGYVFLLPRVDPHARPTWKIDRPAAIAAARQLASEKGVEVAVAESGWSRWWNEPITAEAHSGGLQRYLHAHPGPTTDRLRRLVPAIRARVMLPSARGDERIEVWLDPEGRAFGFRRHFSSPPESQPTPAPEETTVSDEAAKDRAGTLARAQLDRKFHSEIPFDLDQSSANRAIPGMPVYSFTWIGHPPELPELSVVAELAIRGETVVGDQLSLRFRGAEEETATVGIHLTVQEEDGEATSPWQVLVILALVLLGILAFVYAAVRFVRRMREGEMSYARAAVPCGAFFVAMLIQMQNGIDQVQYVLFELSTGVEQVFVSVFLFCFILFFLFVVALVSGFLWAGLEGDVREAFPHKLTTLDTFFSGRFFSRDVAWSTLVGIAFGGPVLLLMALSQLLASSEPAYQTEAAQLLLSRFPVPFLLLNGTVNALLMALTVLLSLSLLLRWIRAAKRALTVLAVVYPVLFAVFGSAFGPEHGITALKAVIVSLMALIPFLACDLVAVFWCAYAAISVRLVLYFFYQPAAGQHTAAAQAIAVAVLALGVLLATRRWGRTYAADEVRPVYAKHIAQRRELEAERSLALEALDRLLPATLPAVPGATLAASCRRGSAASSDYYDFFPLPEGRLGIAVVDVRDRSAASALRLALIKGLLKAFSQRELSPGAVGERLRARLAEVGDELHASLALVYAVYEPSARTLRYLRLGEPPPIFLRGRGGEGSTLDASEGEATVKLRPGDAVILVNEGILKQARAGEEPIRSLRGVIQCCEGEEASSLHDAIRRRIDAKRPANAERGEDQTLVVLELDREASS